MSGASARANQKRRTRKDLLQAAARLLKEGRNPTLEEVAEEALVSRATAYRYFPNVEALLIEAPLDLALPDETAIFAGAPEKDPVARMERVDAAFHDMILENEMALRLMLAKSMERRVAEDDTALPARQNRRTPMIEAALAPSKAEFSRAALDKLQKALALIVGTEAMIVFKDVLQLDEKEAREVKRWAIRALIEAARR
ncbi:TetR/AcrR family transcriptional regulator [Parvibaculum sp.]|jgi:AcrR family transcriptional regulator|uniref:TetR/AcrR family transcriptional regulator n=1 Tax=Parvibaculum sp. TaxID=2024848 RepID=UPI003C78DDD3